MDGGGLVSRGRFGTCCERLEIRTRVAFAMTCMYVGYIVTVDRPVLTTATSYTGVTKCAAVY